MKLLSKKKSKILLDASAKLISDAGSDIIEYEVSYSFDIVNSIKNDSVQVKISVILDDESSSDSESNSSLKFLKKNSQNGSLISKSLLTSSSKKKDKARSKKSSCLTSTKADSSAFMDNAIVGKLKKASSESDIKLLLKSKMKISTKSFKDIVESNESQTILHVVKESDYLQNMSGSLHPKSSRLSLIMNKNLDPSNIGSFLKQDRLTSAEKSTQGVSSLRRFDKELSFEEKSLLFSIMSSIKNVDSSKKGSSNLKISVMTKDSSRNVTAKKNVKISRSALSGKSSLIFRLEALDSSENVIDVLNKKVDHHEEAKRKFAFLTPPDVHAVWVSLGRNVVEIRQNDVNAVGVEIYRKSVDSYVSSLTRYTFLGRVDVKKCDGFIKYFDNVNNVKTCVYRVVPVNFSNDLGVKYGSSVVSGKSNSSLFEVNKLLSKEARHISIVTSVESAGIRVELFNIPFSPIAVKILKRDITVTSKKDFSIFTPKNRDPINTITPGTSVFSVLDHDVKINHTYEYTAMLTFRNGNEARAMSSSRKQFIPINQKSLDINVVGPSVAVSDEGVVDVVFSLSVEIPSSNINSILEILTNSGASGLFLDDLKKEKSKINDLILFSITRTNLTTGDEEFFENVSSGEFSDAQNSSSGNVSSLIPGILYRYTINALMKSSDEVLSDFVKTETDKLTGKIYQFKSAKTRSKFSLKRGLVLSDLSTGDFSTGFEGVQTSFDVFIPSSAKDVIKFADVKFDKKRGNIITWKLNGDGSTIDHFLIISESLGVKSIVGSSHSFFKGTYTYLDDACKDACQIRYLIMPVYNDYSQGLVVGTSFVDVVS